MIAIGREDCEAMLHEQLIGAGEGVPALSHSAWLATKVAVGDQAGSYGLAKPSKARSPCSRRGRSRSGQYPGSAPPRPCAELCGTGGTRGS